MAMVGNGRMNMGGELFFFVGGLGGRCVGAGNMAL